MAPLIAINAELAVAYVYEISQAWTMDHPPMIGDLKFSCDGAAGARQIVHHDNKTVIQCMKMERREQRQLQLNIKHHHLVLDSFFILGSTF